MSAWSQSMLLAAVSGAVCVTATAAADDRPGVQDVIDARRLTRRAYFRGGHTPPSRRIWAENGEWRIEAWPELPEKPIGHANTGWYAAVLSLGGRNYVRLTPSKDFMRGNYILKQGKLVRQGITARTAPDGRTIYNISDVTPEAKQLAATRYHRALESMRSVNARDKRVSASLEMLGTGPIDLYGVGTRIGTLVGKTVEINQFVEGDLAKHYRKHPSDLRVLATLELALLDRQLGNTRRSRERLGRAVKEFRIADLDFRDDAKFRKKLTFTTPFIRPEVALLFLAAEDARRDGDVKVAASYYRVLIRQAPVSPYAWESLVRLRMLADVQKPEIERLQKHLLSFYPCIWGYGEYPVKSLQLGMVTPLNLSKDDFARKHLPEMLQAVEKEVRAVDRWLNEARTKRKDTRKSK